MVETTREEVPNPAVSAVVLSRSNLELSPDEEECAYNVHNVT